MKTFKFTLRRINSFLCDSTLAYALFYLLMFVRPTGFSISAYYFCSVILYFGATYGLFRASFIQKLFGIEIKKRRLNYILFKLLWIAIIPLTLSVLHYDIFLVLYVLAILILSIIFAAFTKKSLWQWCSGAQVELQKDDYKKKSSILILLAVIVAFIIFPVVRSNFRFNIAEFFQNTKNAAFPISMPEKAYYVKNIKQYKEDPINYVMQLFDKYDIVILCERWHPECTQWEFFSKLILNDTFATKVQNVFTEVGRVQNQEQLNFYMNTRFPTEEDLQRATAEIVREGGDLWPVWPNTNFFDFVFHLHQYNATRDSLNRINLFFTDDFNWDSIKNPAQYDSLVRVTNRDSMMAYNFINQYNKLSKKCLLITNTRHAWNFGKNEASYIFKKFPDKTAVVWVNGTTQLTLSPTMNGTLDAAALEIEDSIWAIDFRDCPLGNTHLDLFPRLYKQNSLTYKDLFVGMVYCNPPSKWIRSDNYPFILDNYQDTLLKKSALLGEKYLREQKELIKIGSYDTIDRRGSPFLAITNLSFLLIHSVILLFLFLNLFIKFLLLLFSKKRVDAQ